MPGVAMETDSRNGRGDAEAMTPGVLVHRYAPAVLAVCAANTRSIHDAEDVMQDVFLKAIAKLDTLRDHSRVRAWLLQIARRTCVDHYRGRRPAVALPDDVPADGERNNPAIKRLHAAMSQLPDNYRETIALYYLDGRSCAGVAQSLNISEAAVRQRLVRARLMLHDLLVKEEP